jgi:tRNA threonylcarbamoyladenosine biosynthesis protein TsaB
MRPMLILALDTGTQAGSLAVLRDDRVLGVVSTWVEETYSSRLFRHLEFLLGELSLEMALFDAFAVAAGPGSFTGLRVGLAAVKGWAEVFQKPIAAVSGLGAVAAQASTQVEGSLLVPMMDARRGQVYAGIYRKSAQGLERQGEETVSLASEFLILLEAEAQGAPVTFVTPTPEVLADSLAASRFRGREIETVSAVLAPAIGMLGLARARRGELVDALHLEANYIRSTDAELQWKSR